MSAMRALVDSERYAHMYIAHNDSRNTGKVETTVLTIETGNGETVFAVQGTVQKGEDWKNDAEFGLDDFTIEEDYVANRIQQHMKEHAMKSLVSKASLHSLYGREPFRLRMMQGSFQIAMTIAPPIIS